MAHVTEAATVRAGVLTVSDAGARGERADRSGDVAAERLAALPATVAWRAVVADDAAAIRAAVATGSAVCDLLVTTGGTGLAPRDVTPQTVEPLLDYTIPGMAEVMRARGLSHTPHAMLSRQVAGVRGGCLVLVLPGSPSAVSEGLDAVWEALPHAVGLLRDAHHPHHAGAPGSAA